MGCQAIVRNSIIMRFSKALIAAFAIFTRSAIAASPSKIGDAVVFGEGGTYPRATKLADGSLVGAYTNTQGDNTTIRTVRSEDNGASWQLQGTVDTGPKATQDVDNPYVHELPDGKLLCAFRNHDRASPTTFSYYRITICVSGDGGATWEYLSTPASDPAGVTGNWEPFLQQALDGTLQLYYSRENSRGDQDSLLRRSSDGGKTWTSAQVISGTGIETRDGMIGVARTYVGSETKIAIFESGNPGVGRPFGIWTVRTDNDGVTWSTERTVVYQPDGFNAGAPQIIQVGDKLVASFGTNEDGGLWPGGAIKIMISSDQGRTWTNKTTVREPTAYWAGLLALDGETFLVLYEFEGTSYAQRMTI
ncbi:Sialidase [Boeremia exigua]|uniref:Sialidase n=1 Tax=Boeremia exigua TaxID=749465 RepID=UPI001E8D305B|nr:Sialidase [Boeremia exigua]KAH6621979.1 Sialidase [Boeremia exigua]